MKDCAEGYCSFVMEEVAKARERCADPLVLVEQRLDYSRYVGIEGSFGTRGLRHRCGRASPHH